MLRWRGRIKLLWVLIMVVAMFRSVTFNFFNNMPLEVMVKGDVTTKTGNFMRFTIGKGSHYKARLTQTANSDKVIVLALVDHGFVDVAINFWETSIEPFHIDNMLFVSLSTKACTTLSQLRIPCHVYEDFSGGKDDSTYMSPVFLKKMNTRTQFILDAITWNFTILNTDTDVIFFKNPFAYFKCSDCHMEILEDGISKLLNAGFVYLRPSSITAEVYRRMAAVARKNPRSEDQAVLNRVVKKDLNGKIRFQFFNSSQFMCGMKYYEKGRRYFADTAESCDSCVVVHNNWIVGKAAKIYRQKEMLQWTYDSRGYYSDPNRKYLMYGNPIAFKPSQATEEGRQALINAFAIGQVLNRTVILSRMLCNSGIICPWNSRFYISTLDDAFGGKYRESVFLMHPKVPKEIKESVSPAYLIKSKKYANLIQITDETTKIPKEPEGATSEEIQEWFGDCKHAVLKFHSLYGAFKEFTDKEEQKDFKELAKLAFKKAVYRQY